MVTTDHAMTNLTAAVNITKCRGYGGCQKAAPAAFKLRDDGKAEVLSPAQIHDETLLRGARSCPYRAITITNADDGQQVYPPVRPAPLQK
jgi:ferredoxin